MLKSADVKCNVFVQQNCSLD